MEGRVLWPGKKRLVPACLTGHNPPPSPNPSPLVSERSQGSTWPGEPRIVCGVQAESLLESQIRVRAARGGTEKG